MKDVQGERLPGSVNRAPTRGRRPRRGARSDRAPENFWGFANRLLDRVAAEDWSWSKTLQALLLMGCLAAALVTAAYELTGLPPWAVAIGVGGVGVGARLNASRYGRRRAISGDATPHANGRGACPLAYPPTRFPATYQELLTLDIRERSMLRSIASRQISGSGITFLLGARGMRDGVTFGQRLRSIDPW